MSERWQLAIRIVGIHRFLLDWPVFVTTPPFDPRIAARPENPVPT
jgi:hypothetical protein